MKKFIDEHHMILGYALVAFVLLGMLCLPFAVMADPDESTDESSDLAELFPTSRRLLLTSSSSSVDWSSYKATYASSYDNAASLGSGFTYFSAGNSSTVQGFADVSSAYCFLINTGSNYRLCMASESAFNCWFLHSSTSTYTATLYSDTGLYYGYRASQSFSLENTAACPVFTSVPDALASLRSYLDSSAVFAGQPQTMGSTWDTGIQFATTNLNNGKLLMWNYSSSIWGREFYVFSSPNSEASDDYVYWVSPTSGNSGAWRVYPGKDDYAGTNTYYSLDSSTGLYYGFMRLRDQGGSWGNYVLTCPTFSSFAEGMAAVKAYIDDGHPVQPTPVSSSFTLPAGNVAYFSVSDPSVRVILNTRFAENSGFFSGTWNGQNMMFLRGASLPVSGTTFPLSGMELIPWSRGSSPNLLGQTKDAYTDMVVGSNYFVVYNPLYMAISDDINPDWYYNQPIDITVVGLTDLKVYPLSGSVVVSGSNLSIVSSSESSFEDYYSGSVDSSTGNVLFENQDGVISSPSYGGTNQLPPEVTNQSILQGISNLLSQLVISIENLFSVGHSAIVTLVSIMSGFAGTLTALYSWLPNDVIGAITSSIIICITIGVLKVFL